MAEIEFYNVGDYVLVFKDNKQEIGRIEEIMEQYNTFSYIVFYKAEETQSGRQPHHGKNEIFKTPVNQEEDMTSINSKIEVLKLLDYAKLPREDKLAINRYVCRQNYDPFDGKFSPDLEPDCFCNQDLSLPIFKEIVNPDDDLIVCECDKVYHANCIDSDSFKCLNCENTLAGPGALIKKRKLEDDKTVLLKSNKEDEFSELFNSALDELTESNDKKENNHTNQSNPFANSLNTKRPFTALEIKRVPSNPMQAKPVKKPGRKELINIENDAYERIKNAIDNFSKSHKNKNMQSIESSRYFIKEKYYKSLLYGIEEVNEKQRLAGSHLYLSDAERTIALRGNKENYKLAQDLALNIEAVIWHALNKNKTGLDPNYNMKNRELMNYLMDDNNYELRLSILSGERKPEFLCKASGKELVSKQLNEKIEKKGNQILNYSKLSDDIKIVAKSHKGEIVIEKPPEPKQSESVKEPEPIETEPETIDSLVNQINSGTGERKRSYNPLPSNDDTEFQEFKLTKKTPTQPPKINKVESPPVKTSVPKLEKKGSATKRKEDTTVQYSNAGTNKLIDQEVLKKAMSCFFDRVRTDISERLNSHLRPGIANSILQEIDKKFKNDS